MSTDLAEAGFVPSSPPASPGGISASQLNCTTPRSPSARKEKAASRYLRASGGSCHDLCKYGHKHSFDEKEVHPFLLRRSVSGSVPNKRSLKKFIAGRRKSLVKPGDSSTPKPAKDESTMMQIVKILPAVADAEDANGTKDIESSIPVAEADPLDEDSGSVIMKDESPRKSTESIDDLLPKLRSGSESPLSVVHDIHVVTEQDACLVSTELAEETELSQDQQSSINEADLIRVQSGETGPSAPETTKSPIIRKSIKKGLLPAKTSVESVKSKVKQEVSTPSPALSKLRVVKQMTPVTRKSISAKPTTSCKPIAKAWEQITPMVKSKSPPKSMGGLVNEKTKAGLSSDTRSGASPLKKTKLPSGLVGSRLNLTPPAKSKFQSTSPGSGLNATPPVKSKPRLVSTGDDPKASAAAKSKPPVHPLGGRGRASVEKKAERSMTTPNVERKKPVPSSVSPSVRTSASQSSRPKLIKLGSMNLSASLKSMKNVKPGTGSEKIKEKTIHVDKSKWSNASSGRTVRSRTNRSRLSMSSLASLTSRDGSDCGAGKEARNLKSSERKTRKAGLSPQLEKEAAAPYKLKFRRGKVVNIQPEAAPVATRLTFRRRRVVGRSPNGKGELPQRGHRRRSSLTSDDGISPIQGAGSVVLRHQTEEGPKKETQALLLNQVIEETASKLVETRKSKVKALVGAFETVISLQERKPIEL